jgi:hypothetical protein
MQTLGIGLLVAFIVSAFGAGSASASKFTVNTFGQYKYCPYENPETLECFTGITLGGKNGGYFQLGSVLIKLTKPVTLQGGLASGPDEANGYYKVVPAARGGKTLESPVLKIPGGLSVITPSIQQQAEWPQALKESFKEAKKNKEATAFAELELAGGNQLFEDPDAISSEHLINQDAYGFKLPMKVKITSPWLTKLGGGPCLVGNDEHPVIQLLTTEKPGFLTSVDFSDDFKSVDLVTTLVDLGWPLEPAGGPSGCGGESEAFVDEALRIALRIGPESGGKGLTVLSGHLYDTFNVEKVKELDEKGEL